MADYKLTEDIKKHAENIRQLSEDVHFLTRDLKVLALKLEDMRIAMASPTVRGVRFNVDADDQASVPDWKVD